VWDTICPANSGDVAALRRLLERDPNLYRAENWYTQPIHFAVREGHVEAVQMLLDAGADPAAVGLREDLVIMARDRGHESIALLLEEARARRGSATPAVTDHPIHLAAAASDLKRVRELIEADPDLLRRIDRGGERRDTGRWRRGHMRRWNCCWTAALTFMPCTVPDPAPPAAMRSCGTPARRPERKPQKD
jgi:hypothetical protein